MMSCRCFKKKTELRNTHIQTVCKHHESIAPRKLFMHVTDNSDARNKCHERIRRRTLRKEHSKQGNEIGMSLIFFTEVTTIQTLAEEKYQEDSCRMSTGRKQTCWKTSNSVVSGRKGGAEYLVSSEPAISTQHGTGKL